MTFDDETRHPAAGVGPHEAAPKEQRRERGFGAAGIAAAAGAAGFGAGVGSAAGDELLERVDEAPEEDDDQSDRRDEQIARERLAQAEAAAQAASLDVFNSEIRGAGAMPASEVPEAVHDAAGVTGDALSLVPGEPDGSEPPSISPPTLEIPQESRRDAPSSGAPSIPEVADPIPAPDSSVPVPAGHANDESGAGLESPAIPVPSGAPPFPEPPEAPPFPAPPSFAPPSPGPPPEGIPAFPDIPPSPNVPEAPGAPEAPDAGPVDGGPSVPDEAGDEPIELRPFVPSWPDQATARDIPDLPFLPGAEAGTPDETEGEPASQEDEQPDAPAPPQPPGDALEPPVDAPGAPPPGIPDAHDEEVVEEYGYPRVADYDHEAGWALIEFEDGRRIRYYINGDAYTVDEQGNDLSLTMQVPLLSISAEGDAYFAATSDDLAGDYYMIDIDGGVEYVHAAGIPGYEPPYDSYPRVIEYDREDGWATIEHEDGLLTRFYIGGGGHAVDEHGNVLTNGLANPKLLYVAENGHAYFQMDDPDYGGYRFYLVDVDGGIEYLEPEDIPGYEYEEPVEEEFNTGTAVDEPADNDPEAPIFAMIPDNLPEYFHEERFPNPETSDDYSYSHSEFNSHYFVSADGTKTIIIEQSDDGMISGMSWHDAPPGEISMDSIANVTGELRIQMHPDGSWTTDYYMNPAQPVDGAWFRLSEEEVFAELPDNLPATFDGAFPNPEQSGDFVYERSVSDQGVITHHLYNADRGESIEFATRPDGTIQILWRYPVDDTLIASAAAIISPDGSISVNYPPGYEPDGLTSDGPTGEEAFEYWVADYPGSFLLADRQVAPNPEAQLAAGSSEFQLVSDSGDERVYYNEQEDYSVKIVKQGDPANPWHTFIYYREPADPWLVIDARPDGGFDVLHADVPGMGGEQADSFEQPDLQDFDGIDVSPTDDVGQQAGIPGGAAAGSSSTTFSAQSVSTDEPEPAGEAGQPLEPLQFDVPEATESEEPAEPPAAEAPPMGVDDQSEQPLAEMGQADSELDPALEISSDILVQEDLEAEMDEVEDDGSIP